MIQASRNITDDTLMRYLMNGNRKRQIVVLSSDDEDEIREGQAAVPLLRGSNAYDPIQLSDNEEDEKQEEITEIASIEDQMICDSDSSSELDPLFLESTVALSDEGDLESDVFSLSIALPQTSYQETSAVDMEPPSHVTTYIPKNKTPLESLRMIEMYLESISEPIPIIPNTPSSRASRRNPSALTSNTVMGRPYVPNQVWTHSTWEDWAQLDIGDILHIPFRADEIDILRVLVNKQLSKKHNKRKELDFWQHIAYRLPGRSPVDCRCFWTDYTNGSIQYHNKILMVRQMRGFSGYTLPRYQSLVNRRQLGSRCVVSIKKSLWAGMTTENTISDGSGDAIALAIYNDKNKGVRVVAGSLCDENIQYNVPGNLRLWDLETKSCLSLEGHKTENETTGQEIWRTVSDVKMSNNKEFIFSSSHDGRANIWKARSGRLVSTLRYHSKPINQLAVNRSTNEDVLATCSNDGTATVWYIGARGRSGSGVICQLDQIFYNDPHVECIEFGSESTDNLLFLGIGNNNTLHPGYVEAYDIATGKPRMRFDQMQGCVSSLAVSISGRYIVSGNYNRHDTMSGDQFLHLHDSRFPEKAIKFFTGHRDVNVVAISPCERYVASGNADKERGGEVVVFDVRQTKKKLHLLNHDQTLLNQSLIPSDSSVGIGGLYWMSDSRTMITGGGDSTVKVWGLAGATTLLKKYQTSNCVTSLSVDEETMTIAAGVAGAQGVVHVWQP